MCCWIPKKIKFKFSNSNVYCFCWRVLLLKLNSLYSNLVYLQQTVDGCIFIYDRWHDFAAGFLHPMCKSCCLDTYKKVRSKKNILLKIDKYNYTTQNWKDHLFGLFQKCVTFRWISVKETQIKSSFAVLLSPAF